MSIQDWKDLIGNIGFPVVVTGYLLIRMERAMRDLTNVIANLCERLPK
jgi:hypothetical protein